MNSIINDTGQLHLRELLEVTNNKIKPNPKSKKSYSLQVPEYQRDYAWKAGEHVAQLLEDLHNHLEPYLSSNNKKEHNVQEYAYYLGNIVLVNTQDVKEILDGQQRIITCYIFVAALRNLSLDLINDIDQHKEAQLYWLVHDFLEKLEKLSNGPHKRLNLFNPIDSVHFKWVLDNRAKGLN